MIARCLSIYPFQLIHSDGTYIVDGKPAAAKFALTLIRSALDATATLSPLFLHCLTTVLQHR